MQFLKVSCAGCDCCRQCPRSTRMYVNYCGTHGSQIMDRIRRARSDCFGRRGHTLNFNPVLLSATS